MRSRSPWVARRSTAIPSTTRGLNFHLRNGPNSFPVENSRRFGIDDPGVFHRTGFSNGEFKPSPTPGCRKLLLLSGTWVE